MKRFSLSFLFIFSSTALTSCGISLVDSECNAIRKQSSDKMDLGRTIFEMAMEGKVGSGVTVESAKIQGYRFLVEASDLVINNERCFSANEVSAARALIGK